MIYRYCLFVLIASIMFNCSSKSKTINQTAYYSEKHRPQYHFTPEKNWMNDPNGMVYYEGEYHLFYQHYPDSNVWGPMHWGHAVSKDLVNWEHLPIALYPDGNGLIFSGSVVIDYNNTSGFGLENSPAMVAIFTQHSMGGEKGGRNDFQTQGLAYSTDKGRSWKMYQENPVIKNPGKRDFRDPKVFWHEQTSQWIMVLAVKDHIEIYGSHNLKTWKHLSDFGFDIGAHGGVWECPDLFEMNVKGAEEKKWIMLVSINPGAINGGSGTQYFIGQFDGNNFHSESRDTLWLDYGKDNYAGVTWNNISENDNRKLFIGWMSNWQYATIVPTKPWRSANTLVRSLELVKTDLGLRIASNPVDELKSLRGDPILYNNVIDSTELESDELQLRDSTMEIDLNIQRSSTTDSFELRFYNENGEQLIIGLEGISNQFYLDRTQFNYSFSNDFYGKHFGKRSSINSEVNIKFYFDSSSVELFADNGTMIMSELYFSKKPFSKLKIVSKRGISIESVIIYPLTSIWKHKI